jgi:hypothetical protein
MRIAWQVNSGRCYVLRESLPFLAFIDSALIVSTVQRHQCSNGEYGIGKFSHG